MRKFTLAASALMVGAMTGFAAAGSTVYESDFESDDGGWVRGGTDGFEGDWQWTSSYDVDDYVGEYNPPENAYSGTGMWGTAINDDHQNSSAFSTLTQTFDFSGLSGTTLDFASWSNVFGSFDYNQVVVNGDIVASTNEGEAPYTLTNETSGAIGGEWALESIDLSAYDGLASVEITFRMWATAVVNRPGWYLDDMQITAIPAPGALALLGVAGLVGTRRRRR